MLIREIIYKIWEFSKNNHKIFNLGGKEVCHFFPQLFHKQHIVRRQYFTLYHHNIRNSCQQLMTLTYFWQLSKSNDIDMFLTAVTFLYYHTYLQRSFHKIRKKKTNNINRYVSDMLVHTTEGTNYNFSLETRGKLYGSLHLVCTI